MKGPSRRAWLLTVLAVCAGCTSQAPASPPRNGQSPNPRGLKECGAAALYANQAVAESAQFVTSHLGHNEHRQQLDEGNLLRAIDELGTLQAKCNPFADSASARVRACSDAADAGFELMSDRLGTYDPNVSQSDRELSASLLAGDKQRFQASLRGCGPFSE